MNKNDIIKKINIVGKLKVDNKNEIVELFARKIMKKIEEALELVWSDDETYKDKKYELIKSLASLTSELLDSKEINMKMTEIAESSKVNGDNVEEKFDTFKMIRNVINHFPIFDSWDEIYVSKDLIFWNNPKYSQIKNFFKEEKRMSYKIYLKENDNWVEKKKININVPCLGEYNKIYLKDILSINDVIWTFCVIDYYLQYLGLNITQRFILSI